MAVKPVRAIRSCPGLNPLQPCTFAELAQRRQRIAIPSRSAWTHFRNPTGSRGWMREPTSLRAPSCSATTGSRRAGSPLIRSTRSSGLTPTRSAGVFSPTRLRLRRRRPNEHSLRRASSPARSTRSSSAPAPVTCALGFRAMWSNAWACAPTYRLSTWLARAARRRCPIFSLATRCWHRIRVSTCCQFASR